MLDFSICPQIITWFPSKAFVSINTTELTHRVGKIDITCALCHVHLHGCSMAKVVTFGGANTSANSSAIGENESDSEDSEENIDSGEEFYEITTSEGEPYDTSDEEDAEFLQLALESAYACSPRKAREPAELSSYLLLDKDFVEDDDIDDLGNCLLSLSGVANYAFFWLLGHESAVSEISLCTSGVGCGTTTTDDDEEFLPPKKKRRKMTRSTSAVSRSTDDDRRDHPDDEDKGNTKTKGKGGKAKGGKGRKTPQHQSKGSSSKTQSKVEQSQQRGSTDKGKDATIEKQRYECMNLDKCVCE